MIITDERSKTLSQTHAPKSWSSWQQGSPTLLHTDCTWPLGKLSLVEWLVSLNLSPISHSQLSAWCTGAVNERWGLYMVARTRVWLRYAQDKGHDTTKHVRILPSICVKSTVSPLTGAPARALLCSVPCFKNTPI